MDYMEREANTHDATGKNIHIQSLCVTKCSHGLEGSKLPNLHKFGLMVLNRKKIQVREYK